MTRISTKKHFIPIIILILVSVALFSNTLCNSIMWDDTYLIEHNRYIKSLKHIPLFFTPHYWNNLHPYKRLGQYRPIRTATFAVDYAIWKLNPAGYHITNLLLHTINVILVYFWVCLLLFIANNLEATGKKWAWLFSLPFLTALLFAAHPIHTESVTYIKNRSDLIAFMFFISSFLIYIKYPLRKGTLVRFLSFLSSLLCFAFAIISKEMALTLPFVLMLYIICFLPVEKYKKAMLKTLPYFGVMILYFCFKLTTLKTVTSTGSDPGINIYQHAMIVFKTIGYYLKLLVLPVNLNAERVFLMPKSIIDPTVLSSILLVAIICILSLRTFKISKTFFFAIFWILITLFPASNVIYLASRPIAEQRLYIPSFGLCLLLAIGIGKLFSFESERFSRKTSISFAALFVVLLLASYSTITARRNLDWRDPFTFCSKTVESSPNSHRAHLNLGVALADKGRLEEALGHYKTALRLKPDYAMAYYKIGNVFLKRGEVHAAMERYTQALKYDPSYAHAYNNMGVALMKQGRINEAIQYYSRAVKIKSDYADAHNNLGSALASKGKYREASHHFRTALRIMPEFATAGRNLKLCLELMNKSSGAKSGNAAGQRSFPQQVK